VLYLFRKPDRNNQYIKKSIFFTKYELFTLVYIALVYIALVYIALVYIALVYIALVYITLVYIALENWTLYFCQFTKTRYTIYFHDKINLISREKYCAKNQ
jgi:hypothetical protein